jgi:hypothetical protein
MMTWATTHRKNQEKNEKPFFSSGCTRNAMQVADPLVKVLRSVGSRWGLAEV